MLCYLDGPEEALAGMLRPGNAGANTAADQIEVVDRALDQLPRSVVERAELLLRTDSAGLAHDLLDHLHEADIRFSVGMDMTEGVRQAVLGSAIGTGFRPSPPTASRGSGRSSPSSRSTSRLARRLARDLPPRAHAWPTRRQHRIEPGEAGSDLPARSSASSRLGHRQATIQGRRQTSPASLTPREPFPDQRRSPSAG